MVIKNLTIEVADGNGHVIDLFKIMQLAFEHKIQELESRLESLENKTNQEKAEYNKKISKLEQDVQELKVGC